MGPQFGTGSQRRETGIAGPGRALNFGIAAQTRGEDVMDQQTAEPIKVFWQPG